MKNNIEEFVSVIDQVAGNRFNYINYCKVKAVINTLNYIRESFRKKLKEYVTENCS